MPSCAAIDSPCSPSCAGSSRASPIFPVCQARRRPNYMQMLRSVIFTVFMAVWTIPFAFVYCIVCPFLPFRGRFWFTGIMTRPVFFALKHLCGLTYTVEGRENLPPGNHVIFMKHSSTWETYGIMILFPPLVWVMKREIYWIPFVGWGCMLARCIAIDRKAGTAAV